MTPTMMWTKLSWTISTKVLQNGSGISYGKNA
jgi:hypothetical protein